jgi:GNAT superfamily N-acetyltransferase
MAMALPLVDLPEKLVVTYLEMTARDQFPPAATVTLDEVDIIEAVKPDVDFYRFLYKSVGYHLRWRDRLLMADTDLTAILHAPRNSVYVQYERGVPAGYIELERQGSDTEIAFFGLRPHYQGRGLGKVLLNFGIQRAWDDGAARLWVHTCNMDGAAALDNYLKRGFSIYRVEEEPMPDRYKT